MASGLPLKEIRTLLNKPGEEIDERWKAMQRRGVDVSRVETGYIVELVGNLEKTAEGEIEFVGTASTGVKVLPPEVMPVDIDAEGGISKRWTRRGKGDVFLQFWLKIK